MQRDIVRNGADGKLFFLSMRIYYYTTETAGRAVAVDARPCTERPKEIVRHIGARWEIQTPADNLFFKYIEVERNTPEITICVDLSNSDIFEVGILEN